jgi:hypothetical protein
MAEDQRHEHHTVSGDLDREPLVGPYTTTGMILGVALGGLVGAIAGVALGQRR